MNELFESERYTSFSWKISNAFDIDPFILLDESDSASVTNIAGSRILNLLDIHKHI